MRYVSTRGQAPIRDFAGVLLAGLAEDGGLYVPQTWPSRTDAEWRALRGLPYPELAARVMHPFMGDCIPFDVLLGMCRDAYAGFAHPAVVPLVQLDTDLWTQELFHGPTLAFKDMGHAAVGPPVRLCPGRARRADHHRRCHLRRYRLGGDRGLRQPRAHRHRHPAPA